MGMRGEATGQTSFLDPEQRPRCSPRAQSTHSCPFSFRLEPVTKKGQGGLGAARAPGKRRAPIQPDVATQQLAVGPSAPQTSPPDRSRRPLRSGKRGAGRAPGWPGEEAPDHRGWELRVLGPRCRECDFFNPMSNVGSSGAPVPGSVRLRRGGPAYKWQWLSAAGRHRLR